MAKREQSIQSKVKSLVVAECDSHQATGPFGTKNYCWAKEKSNGGLCVFFTEGIENPRCQYFEQAVLPLDRDLKAIFSSELLNLEIREGQKRMVRKRCGWPGCLQTFLSKSNAQRFCPKCQRAAWNEKTRVRMANLRKKPIGISVVTI